MPLALTNALWEVAYAYHAEAEEDLTDSGRVVARLDRKRLGADCRGRSGISIRGVFDKETRRKPLAFAADAVRYGI